MRPFTEAVHLLTQFKALWNQLEPRDKALLKDLADHLLMDPTPRRLEEVPPTPEADPHT